MSQVKRCESIFRAELEPSWSIPGIKAIVHGISFVLGRLYSVFDLEDMLITVRKWDYTLRPHYRKGSNDQTEWVVGTSSRVGSWGNCQ